MAKKRLSPRMEKLINEQIQKELTNSLAYLAMSNWYNFKGWFGASELFKTYSDDEIIHRDKFINYMLDLDSMPIVPSTTFAPIPNEYKDMKEIVNAAFQREQDTTESLEKIKMAALEEKDFVTVDFIDWFLLEQIEELAKTLYWIDRIEMMESTGASLYHLDKEMKEKV